MIANMINLIINDYQLQVVAKWLIVKDNHIYTSINEYLK
jgi:hypothetical protein